MERNDVANLTRIANYVKVQPGKIEINKEKVVCRLTKNKNQCGYATIISALGRESKQDSFASCDYVKQCLIAQWFDYAVLFVGQAINSKTTSDALLQELNDYLLTRSYLVGHNLTLADVVVFYSIYNIMSSLSSASKEKYGNVARWFDHLQKINSIRQNLPTINLSNLLLHGWATGTHT